MKEVFEFVKNHYSTILSISAFIISLINLIYLLTTNKKKLKVNIANFTICNVNNKHFYMFNVELINESRLPISVNEIIFKDNKKEYKVIKSPRMLAEKDRKRNNEIIKHQEIHSAKFPINVVGLSSEQKFIVMYGPEKITNDNSKIIINTNRGKVTQKVNLNNNYLSSEEFAKETSEYYD